MTRRLFGILPDGREVHAYLLQNGKMKAEILDLGGTLRSLCVGDTDVIGGYDTLDGILTDTTYQGALIGRYGNRIARARFELNGVEYPLYANNGRNHLHGGKEGFNRKLWTVETAEDDRLVLTYVSPDGEEGYPGTLSVKVTYVLYADAIGIFYEASSDKDTYCNLTNHAYFNLDGVGAGEITSHTLRINADTYTAVDSELIPTGEHPVLLPGDPFDFREPKTVGRDLVGATREDPLYGYDHNFILNDREHEVFDGTDYRVAAEVSGKKITMKVLTTMPCMQVYTGAFLEDDGNHFKGNTRKFARMAMAMETQYEPDSPSRHENILRAGERFVASTVYRF